MAVAIMTIIMLRNILIMITMMDNNDSFSNPHNINDGKDDNDDSSDNNDDQTMNAQITGHLYMEGFFRF